MFGKDKAMNEMAESVLTHLIDFCKFNRKSDKRPLDPVASVE